jgi:hypothetical protein
MNKELNTKMKQLLTNLIERTISKETFTWLFDKAALISDSTSSFQLNVTFAAIPRKTGKKELDVKESESNEINNFLPGFSIHHWTIDRLCRVWLLMQLDCADKENYINTIENLFPQAEMNEQVALYSALPLLAHADAWKLPCAVGIRSNIGTVLEAIMYHNPYPATYLDESAWNQLIMKAFFTGKNVNNICGLDERANQHLANMLFDYVEERWAASRIADPQIWRLTAKFLDDAHFYMIERLFASENKTEQQAAALACAASSFEKATLILGQHPEYKSAIVQNTLSWGEIAKQESFFTK